MEILKSKELNKGLLDGAIIYGILTAAYFGLQFYSQKLDFAFLFILLSMAIIVLIAMVYRGLFIKMVKVLKVIDGKYSYLIRKNGAENILAQFTIEETNGVKIYKDKKTDRALICLLELNVGGRFRGIAFTPFAYEDVNSIQNILTKEFNREPEIKYVGPIFFWNRRKYL